MHRPPILLVLLLVELSCLLVFTRSALVHLDSRRDENPLIIHFREKASIAKRLEDLTSALSSSSPKGDYSNVFRVIRDLAKVDFRDAVHADDLPIPLLTESEALQLSLVVNNTVGSALSALDKLEARVPDIRVKADDDIRLLITLGRVSFRWEEPARYYTVLLGSRPLVPSSYGQTIRTTASQLTNRLFASDTHWRLSLPLPPRAFYNITPAEEFDWQVPLLVELDARIDRAKAFAGEAAKLTIGRASEGQGEGVLDASAFETVFMYEQWAEWPETADMHRTLNKIDDAMALRVLDLMQQYTGPILDGYDLLREDYARDKARYKSDGVEQILVQLTYFERYHYSEWLPSVVSRFPDSAFAQGRAYLEQFLVQYDAHRLFWLGVASTDAAKR